MNMDRRAVRWALNVVLFLVMMAFMVWNTWKHLEARWTVGRWRSRRTKRKNRGKQ